MPVKTKSRKDTKNERSFIIQVMSLIIDNVTNNGPKLRRMPEWEPHLGKGVEWERGGRGGGAPCFALETKKNPLACDFVLIHSYLTKIVRLLMN
jgi:hypothetical protein